MRILKIGLIPFKVIFAFLLMVATFAFLAFYEDELEDLSKELER